MSTVRHAAAISSAKKGGVKKDGRPGFGQTLGFGSTGGGGGFGSTGRQATKEYESKAQSNSRYVLHVVSSSHGLEACAPSFLAETWTIHMHCVLVASCFGRRIRYANAKHISSDDFNTDGENGGRLQQQ